MINATGNQLTMEIRRQGSLADAISRSQINISTGKKIQMASDDPVAAARVATIERAQANDETWQSNLNLGLSLANQADDVLSTLNDRLVRVQELMIAGANGTLSDDDRTTYAVEIAGIADEIDSYMGTKSSLGEPLFAAANEREMRFNESAVFAPVPSRDDVFGTGANILGQIVRDAANAIATGNDATLSSSLDAVQDTIGRVADRSADIGVRASRMDSLRETMEARAIDYAAERSGLEDTNLAEAIARLNAETITLEAAQAAFARINQRTLFDILS